jgi:IBR domain, a half RING-finger domain
MPYLEQDTTDIPPTTASCDEVVAFELSQHRPKACEIQFTYLTCLDTLPLQWFPVIPITSRCFRELHRAANQSFICKSCLNHSINAQLSSSRPDNMDCSLCHQRMTHHDIKRWAEPETFEKYDRLITLQAIQQDRSSVRCCQPECEGIQFHDGDADSPIATCHECGIMTCFRHSGLPWHEGLTCDEFEDPHTAVKLLRDLINDLELASGVSGIKLSTGQSHGTSVDREMQFKHRTAKRLLSERQARLTSDSDEKGAKAVAETTKPCPSCDTPIEKVGGCKHVKCRCGYQLCYGCLAPWNRAHLMSPCSNEDHSFGVMPLLGMYRPPNREVRRPLPGSTHNARFLRAPRLESHAGGRMDALGPGFDVREAVNLDNFAVPGENAPLPTLAPEVRRQPPAILAPPSLIPPRLGGPRLHAQDVRGLNRQFYSQDQQMSSGQLAQPQIPEMAQTNQQRFQVGLGSGPGARGHFTRALEEALVESGALRMNAAFQHIQPRSRVPYSMQNTPAEVDRDIRMRNPARQHVQESRVMGPSSIETFRSADQDFAMRYQGLQRPFDPDYTRAQLVGSRMEPVRAENELARRGAFLGGIG